MKKYKLSDFFASDYGKILSGLVSVFAVIYLYALEIHWFNNTFNAIGLLMIGLALGCIGGAIAGWRLKDKGKDLMEQFVYFILCLFCGLLLFPLLFSLTNRVLSPYSVVEEEVEFVEANAYIGSRFGRVKDMPSREDGFHIFFIREDRLERIKSQTNPYEGVRKGELIRLPVKKGLLGFDVVCLK